MGTHCVLYSVQSPRRREGKFRCDIINFVDLQVQVTSRKPWPSNQCKPLSTHCAMQTSTYLFICKKNPLEIDSVSQCWCGDSPYFWETAWRRCFFLEWVTNCDNDGNKIGVCGLPFGGDYMGCRHSLCVGWNETFCSKCRALYTLGYIALVKDEDGKITSYKNCFFWQVQIEWTSNFNKGVSWFHI